MTSKLPSTAATTGLENRRMGGEAGRDGGGEHGREGEGKVTDEGEGKVSEAWASRKRR